MSTRFTEQHVEDRLVALIALLFCAILMVGVCWEADVIYKQKQLIKVLWQDTANCHGRNP